jgi:carbon monoxide dehydrogenase subunit G
MIKASGTTHVARSPEHCFDFIADLHNEPSFNPDASDIVKTTPGPIGLGTVYTETVKPLGHFEVEIDRYERPGMLGFDARNAKAHIPVRFRFAPEGDGTRIEVDLEMHLRGPVRLLEPVMRPMVKRMYEKQRKPRLKAALEAS